jgi:hypothetical protein
MLWPEHLARPLETAVGVMLVSLGAQWARMPGR